MAVIAIARGTLNAATELSGSLSRALGWNVVTREEVYDAARAFGIEETGLGELSFVDERPPSFWYAHSDKRRRYLACFQAALMDKAMRDDLIYVGHLGHLLISGFGHVLRVRLAAPEAYRVKALVRERRMTQAQAIGFIREVDERRLRWSQFLYGVDWRTPELYDLVLNPEKLCVGAMTESVVAITRCAEMQTTPHDRRRMGDLHLAAVSRAILLRDPSTRGIEWEVVAHSDTGRLEVYCPHVSAGSIAGTVAGIFPFTGGESFEVAGDRDSHIRDLLRKIRGVTSVQVVLGEAPPSTDLAD